MPLGQSSCFVIVNVEPRSKGRESRPRLGRTVYLAELGAVAGAYFLTGKLGLSLAITQTNVTLIWPPTGIALAAILLRGYPMWPGVALGAFLVNISTEIPLFTVLGIVAGNTGAALIGAWLLRGARMDLRMLRSWDVLGLLALGALAPTG